MAGLLYLSTRIVHSISGGVVALLPAGHPDGRAICASIILMEKISKHRLDVTYTWNSIVFM